MEDQPYNQEFYRDFSNNFLNVTQVESITAPGAVLRGPTEKFLNNYDSSSRDVSFFCDKTFVVRPTNDPKKLKFTKICQKLVENR